MINKKQILFFGIFVAPILFLTLVRTNIDYEQHTKPYILCTTSIIGDTVQQLVGDTVEIHTLMGPGIDPHLYKAREGDVHRLARANIIFYNGLHLEGKMAHILHQMNSYTASIAVADALDAQDLLDAGIEGIHDPHIWHDVILWIKVVKHITSILCAKIPQHAQLYQNNAHALCTQLQELDHYIKNKIATIAENKRILVTAHDAFSYFGKRYGMSVVGLQGVSTDAEISAGDVQNLVDYLVEQQLHAIFIESSIPQRSIEAVQCRYSTQLVRNYWGRALFRRPRGYTVMLIIMAL